MHSLCLCFMWSAKRPSFLRSNCRMNQQTPLRVDRITRSLPAGMMVTFETETHIQSNPTFSLVLFLRDASPMQTIARLWFLLHRIFNPIGKAPIEPQKL